MLKEGQVAEQGTFQDLIARPNGLFRKLVEQQLGGLTDAIDEETTSTDTVVKLPEEVKDKILASAA